MILTHENYHTPENKFLTGSKIKDFLKCKDRFNHLHILHDIIRKGKDAWNVGSATDAWLTGSKKKFLTEYVGVTRRSLKNPPPGITELTMKQYDEVVRMCEVVEKQPAFLALADHEAQKIISFEMPIGKHFDGLSFMMDWFKIEEGVAIITDLKTSVETDERKWHYKCEDFGYYMQFAVATAILRKTNPEIKKFVYRHLVIDKNEDVNTPYTFIIDNERVEVYLNILLNDIIPQVSAETEFKPKQVAWENAPTVGALNADFD